MDKCVHELHGLVNFHYSVIHIAFVLVIVIVFLDISTEVPCNFVLFYSVKFT